MGVATIPQDHCEHAVKEKAEIVYAVSLVRLWFVVWYTQFWVVSVVAMYKVCARHAVLFQKCKSAHICGRQLAVDVEHN